MFTLIAVLAVIMAISTKLAKLATEKQFELTIRGSYSKSSIAVCFHEKKDNCERTKPLLLVHMYLSNNAVPWVIPCCITIFLHSKL